MIRNLALLLPAIFPSWRFFDAVAPSPRIEFALLARAQDTPDHWQECYTKPATISLRGMMGRLFWNAPCNEALFLVSCAERLMENPTQHSHDEIVKRIGANLQRRGVTVTFLQFRLAVITRRSTALHKEIAYLSPVHAYEEFAS